jgi:hypothetical protein
MRRFLIKGRFKGKVEVIYDGNGLLRKIDFAGAELTAEAVKWFKARTAVRVENINEGFENYVTIAEAEFETTFADFRREYPYTRNAHLAEKYWPTMTSSNQYRAFIEAVEYRKYCERNSNWYKPKMADKWLKEQQYLNNWREL